MMSLKLTIKIIAFFLGHPVFAFAVLLNLTQLLECCIELMFILGKRMSYEMTLL